MSPAKPRESGPEQTNPAREKIQNKTPMTLLEEHLHLVNQQCNTKIIIFLNAEHILM